MGGPLAEPAGRRVERGGAGRLAGNDAERDGAGRAPGRRIAVLGPGRDAGGRGRGAGLDQAAALLLADLEDAYAAYERMSSYRGDDAEPTAFVESGGEPCGTAIAVCTADAMPQTAAIAAALGASRTAASDPSRGASPVAADGAARAYLVVVCPSADGREGLRALERLGGELLSRGIVLSGAVIVTHGGQIPTLMRTPRLGMWRRPVAEAIDRLIAAMRMESALDAPIIASPSRLWLRLRGLAR